MSPGLRAAKLAALVALLAAIAAIAVVLGRDGPPAGPKASPFLDLASVEPETRLADAQPGRVRIVVAPKDMEMEDVEAFASTAPAILDVGHLGPLAAKECAALRDLCNRLAVKRQARFDARNTDATASADLLAEATMLYELRVAQAADDALSRGSYLVLPQQDSLPLTMPGAEVLACGSKKDGAEVNIAIVIAHEAYPDVRDARSYFEDMQLFDDSEKARKFNSLPDAERTAIAVKIRWLQQKDTRSDDEAAFLHETLGTTTRLEGDRLFVFSHR